MQVALKIECGKHLHIKFVKTNFLPQLECQLRHGIYCDMQNYPMGPHEVAKILHLVLIINNMALKIQ